jgi:hypothetical protein
MDEGRENKWLIDSGCSRHMIRKKKWFSSLIPLSHHLSFGKEYANLHVLFHKSGSQVLDSSSKLVCGISCIEKVFQADFSFAQFL